MILCYFFLFVLNFSASGEAVDGFSPKQANEPHEAKDSCSIIRDNPDSYSLPFTSTRQFSLSIEKTGGFNKFLSTYGLHPPSKEQRQTVNKNLPMGFSYSSDKKNIHINCFLCHGSTVNGVPYEGAPNNQLLIQKLISEVGDLSLHKFAFGLWGGKFGPEQRAGATYAQDFTRFSMVARRYGHLSYPSKQEVLSVITSASKNENTAVYAPSWWDQGPGLRQTSFIDGALDTSSAHMALFASASMLSTKELSALREQFEQMLSCVRKTPIPKYIGSIDSLSSQRGEQIFNGTRFSRNPDCKCTTCHNSSGSAYLERRIFLDAVGTDATYSKNLGLVFKYQTNNYLNKIGFSSHLNYDKKKVIIAPTLRGLSARNALLHNRSVPNLKELLCKDQKNRVRHFSQDPHRNVFQQISTSTSFPIYDTQSPGFSNQGHNFCTKELETDAQSCQDLIEYIKNF